MPSPGGESGGRSKAGGSRLGCILGLALLGLGVYAATVVVDSEFRFRSVQEAVRQQARVATGKSEREIREQLLREIGDLDLPPAARRIYVRRGDGSIRISLDYSDTLTFFDRWTWVRDRHVAARGRD